MTEHFQHVDEHGTSTILINSNDIAFITTYPTIKGTVVFIKNDREEFLRYVILEDESSLREKLGLTDFINPQHEPDSLN